MFKMRGQVQGFVVGAAVVVAIMLAAPALASAPAAATDPNQIAAEFNVTIHWQGIVKCGTEEAMGCFYPDTPDTIFVKTGLDPSETRYVILHEIGHVSQSRLGLDLNECNADEFARSLGGYRNIGRSC